MHAPTSTTRKLLNSAKAACRWLSKPHYSSVAVSRSGKPNALQVVAGWLTQPYYSRIAVARGYQPADRPSR